MKLFADRGWNPRHDLGQNFLIDLNLHDYIIREAELTERDVVLEVGAGTGGLTKQLGEHAGAVVSVEYDKHVASLAADALADSPRVNLLVMDILHNKSTLAPVVMDALREQLSRDPERRIKLVANLPYHVAGPILANLIASDLPWVRMIVTIQYEAAQRLEAASGTDDYSALSVWIQSQARIKILKKLSPQVFWPRPKVDSAIVRIDPDPEAAARISNRPFLQDFLRQLFTHRRKTLRTVMGMFFSERMSKPDVETFLQQRNLSETIRAEEVPVAVLVEFANRLSVA